MTVVSGKGGVGKSTVVAACATALARAGARVLVVEPNGPHRLPALLGARTVPAGGSGPVAPGIWGLFLDPEATMEAYMRAHVRVRLIADRIVRSHVYERFVAAAPGLKELVVLGKIMMVYRGRHQIDGIAGFDHLLLDAPATGHGVQLLRVPRLTLDTFGDGPLTREARRVQTMLKAPGTFVDVVTLPEEMPVNEALELEQTIGDSLGLRVGQLIVNALVPPIGRPGVDWVSDHPPAGELAAAASRAAHWCTARARMQAGHLERAREGSRARLATLPFIFERDERRIVEILAEHLARPSAPPASAAAGARREEG